MLLSAKRIWLWELSELRGFPLVFTFPLTCFNEFEELFFLVLSVLEAVLMFLSAFAFVFLSVLPPFFLSVLASVMFSLLLLPADPCAVLFSLLGELPFRDGVFPAFPLWGDFFDVLPSLLFEGAEAAFLLSSVKK